jgi:hypothetical protein
MEAKLNKSEFRVIQMRIMSLLEVFDFFSAVVLSNIDSLIMRREERQEGELPPADK